MVTTVTRLIWLSQQSGTLPKCSGRNSRSGIIVPHVGVSRLLNYFNSNCVGHEEYQTENPLLNTPTAIPLLTPSVYTWMLLLKSDFVVYSGAAQAPCTSNIFKLQVKFKLVAGQ